MIVVTESYIKGVLCAEAGYPALALNGVSGYSHEGGLSPDFFDPHEFWQGRRIAPLFDSLSVTREVSARNVLRARRKLARLMVATHGCEVLDTNLPPVPSTTEFPDGDWGIDDFVMHNGGGAAGLSALRVVIEQAEPFVLTHLADEKEDSDLANAERLYARYGQDLLYTPKRKVVTWDGKRWRPSGSDTMAI